MKFTYDASADCGYVAVREIEAGGVARTIEVKVAPQGIFGSLNIDIDHQGRVCGIEVLGASTILPELLELARSDS